MIADVENVVKWLEVNGLEHFSVKVKEGDNALVFESDESLTISDNFSKFRKVMDLCTGNRFFIKASTKKGVNRGNYSEEFKNITGMPSAIGSSLPMQAVGASPEDVQKQIDNAISGFKTQLVLEQQANEIKELRQVVRENDTVKTAFYAKLTPFIGQIAAAVIGKVIPQAPALGIAGIEQSNVSFDVIEDENEPETEKESTNENADRLQIALEAWSNADPDFITLIEAVANLASTKDPMYAMAKNMLIK